MTDRAAKTPAPSWDFQGSAGHAHRWLCRTSGVAGGFGAPNKANPGRGGLGIDYGLGMIDDWEFRGNGPAIRQRAAPNKPNLACSVPVRASGENALRRHYEQAKQTQSAGPVRPEAATDGAKQTQFLVFWPENEGPR